MTSRSVFLLILCFALYHSSSAQKTQINQVFGIGASFADVKGVARLDTGTSHIQSDFSLRLQQFGFVYGVRANLVSWGRGSISIGAPVMLGFGTQTNYRSVDFDGTRRDTIEGLKGTRIALEIPVYTDLNIGLYSAADELRNHNFGIYIGAGYAYGYTRIHTSVGKLNYDGFDPVFHAGIRSGASWESRFSLAFTVRGISQRMYGIQLLKEL